MDIINNEAFKKALGKNKSVTVTVAGTAKKGLFYMIRKTDDRSEPDGIDQILEFTTKEKFVFRELKNKLDYNDNTVMIDTVEYSDADRSRFSAGFKSLEKKGLVKRVMRSGSRNVFMISPHFIMPSKYDIALDKWDNI